MSAIHHQTFFTTTPPSLSEKGARLCRRPAVAGWQLLRLAFSTVALRFMVSRKIAALTAACVLSAAACFAGNKPNVIVIMPDNLSYDDFTFYNQPGPRTPNLDSLARESVRLTDFHVSPTCSPTRAALMTGRYNHATGVWHTILGRYFLRADEVTMTDVFKANGYRTALIGKWHLGDASPQTARWSRRRG